MDLETIIPKSNDPEIIQKVSHDSDAYEDMLTDVEELKRKRRRKREHMDSADDMCSDHGVVERYDEKFPRKMKKIADDLSDVIDDDPSDDSDDCEVIVPAKQIKKQKRKTMKNQPYFKYSPETGEILSVAGHEYIYEDEILKRIQEQEMINRRNNRRNILFVVSVVLLVVIALVVLYKLVMKWDEKRMIASANNAVNGALYERVGDATKTRLHTTKYDDEYTNVNNVEDEQEEIDLGVDKAMRQSRKYQPKQNVMSGGQKGKSIRHYRETCSEKSPNRNRFNNSLKKNSNGSGKDVSNHRFIKKVQQERERVEQPAREQPPTPAKIIRDARGRFVKRS